LEWWIKLKVGRGITRFIEWNHIEQQRTAMHHDHGKKAHKL
jgi:hypothetical protein